VRNQQVLPWIGDQHEPLVDRNIEQGAGTCWEEHPTSGVDGHPATGDPA
jgi:hypothetical protein